MSIKRLPFCFLNFSGREERRVVGFVHQEGVGPVEPDPGEQERHVHRPVPQGRLQA